MPDLGKVSTFTGSEVLQRLKVNSSFLAVFLVILAVTDVGGDDDDEFLE